MAKRTVTSKGMRVRLRSTNKQIEVLIGTVTGLKQQLMLKEQTISQLEEERYELKQKLDALCTESDDEGQDSGVTPTSPTPSEQGTDGPPDGLITTVTSDHPT